MPDIKITDEMRGIINQCRFEGNKVYLPSGQLDRKLYVKINALLEECEGKWSKKEKCHVFPSDPREKLGVLVVQEKLIDSQKARQAYYTPLWLVEKVVTLADVKEKTVFEPSFGDGRFIKECAKQGACQIDGVELDKESYEGAQKEINALLSSMTQANSNSEPLIHLANADFLMWPLSENLDGQVVGYQVVIGNPPFRRTDWLKHTLHAYQFVKPGGKLVFILPNSIHSNKKFQDFVVDKDWTFEKVEGGSFEDTNIETNIVIIHKS